MRFVRVVENERLVEPVYRVFLADEKVAFRCAAVPLAFLVSNRMNSKTYRIVADYHIGLNYVKPPLFLIDIDLGIYNIGQGREIVNPHRLFCPGRFPLRCAVLRLFLLA